MPIILRQARLQAGKRLRKPLTLVMSDLWARDLQPKEIEAFTDIAELVITKRIENESSNFADMRNQSLSAMRRVLVEAQNVMVAVGGKMHSADGFIPGVGEEMNLAQEKGIPRFLIAGLGGFSRKLSKQLTPSSLHNSLPQKTNEVLFSSKDVSASVNVLFEHLARSKQLAQSALQPIKWNPGLQAIVDHRDGTVHDQSTRYILRAIAI